ncbi:MAG: AzlD domain-containing protein [Eubacteriales bacterium]|nr:AzlD domain-containing protein [Eubacteriales bacterium]
MNVLHSSLIVAVTAAVTIGIRFLPFLLFKDHVPEPIIYLGKVLPYAIIGMLVVYCLKGMNLLSGHHGLAEILAVLIVFLLHKWKHNTLISIVGGTVSYMILVQMIFV